MRFSEKLKEARKQAGLSQEQLAEKLSVSRSAVAKWESDLGLPEVENLKILSQLLNLSMDALTDNTRTLEEAARTSTSTCCGKSCDGCTDQAALECPGCRKLDHHGVDGCAIARCCQGKRLDTCNSCSYCQTCNTLRSRDYVPSKRLTALNTHKAQQKALADRSAAYIGWIAKAYPTLRKWVPLLFGAYLLPTLAELIRLIPSMVKPAALLTALLPLGYALLLLKLSPVHSHYKKAAFFWMASVVAAIAALFLPSVTDTLAALKDAMSQNAENVGELWHAYDTAQLLDTVANSICSALLFAAAFFEYHAHAEVLAPFCKECAQEWLRLWKWEAVITGGSLSLSVAILLLPFLSGLFALILVPLALGSFVLFGLHWVALFRLSRYFRRITAEEMLQSTDTTVPIPS